MFRCQEGKRLPAGGAEFVKSIVHRRRSRGPSRYGALTRVFRSTAGRFGVAWIGKRASRYEIWD
jgi:hypothetical protein